jgi:hypothetical protein
LVPLQRSQKRFQRALGPFLGPEDLFLGDPFGVGPGGSKIASTLVGIVCIVESPRDLPYRDIIVPANIIIANLYPHMVHLSLIQQ